MHFCYHSLSYNNYGFVSSAQLRNYRLAWLFMELSDDVFHIKFHVITLVEPKTFTYYSALGDRDPSGRNQVTRSVIGALDRLYPITPPPPSRRQFSEPLNTTSDDRQNIGLNWKYFDVCTGHFRYGRKRRSFMYGLYPNCQL